MLALPYLLPLQSSLCCVFVDIVKEVLIPVCHWDHSWWWCFPVFCPSSLCTWPGTCSLRHTWKQLFLWHPWNEPYTYFKLVLNRARLCWKFTIVMKQNSFKIESITRIKKTVTEWNNPLAVLGEKNVCKCLDLFLIFCRECEFIVLRSIYARQTLSWDAAGIIVYSKPVIKNRCFSNCLNMH